MLSPTQYRFKDSRFLPIFKEYDDTWVCELPDKKGYVWNNCGIPSQIHLYKQYPVLRECFELHDLRVKENAEKSKGMVEESSLNMSEMLNSITDIANEKKLDTEDTGKMSSNIKKQRATKNLGLNTARTQEESYMEIEKIRSTAKCTDGEHIGERMLSVRDFYLNKGGKGLQGACITCQKRRRANRIHRSRVKFENKSKEEIISMYIETYSRRDKQCSKCKTFKELSYFTISPSMECGIHNQCMECCLELSQGNGGLRDFIFMPDKDGIRYKKKKACERCGGTDKLAVDHILPIAKGGTDCIGNKQTLCCHCNSKKNDTIDCVVNVDMLCNRYRDDTTTLLDFSDFTNVSRVLSKRVAMFKQEHILNASLADIRVSVTEYIKTNNLGHTVDRIVGKIQKLFNKG